MIEAQEPTPIGDPATWDQALLELPQPHLLQTWTWGAIKRAHGWTPQRLLWHSSAGEPLAAAQVLQRTLGPPGLSFTVFYCPKGPILEWDRETLRGQVLTDLRDLAEDNSAVQLKLDPDVPVGRGVPGSEEEEPSPLGPALEQQLAASGWQPSPEQIQFRNTMILDLRRSEDEILADMKQKTRYNVRLAGRRGVEIREGSLEDLDLLYDIYAETSLRDGFVIRSRDYYQTAWGEFIEKGLAQPLIAEVESEPVAALIPYRFGERAWYLYGMSRDRHRKKMPNYLLQWEAIRWAKARGCTSYDLWGAPDSFDRSDPLWGVYRFKRGFRATVFRTIGAWDYTPRPLIYSAYHRLLPPVLDVMRLFGRRQTASNLD